MGKQLKQFAFVILGALSFWLLTHAFIWDFIANENMLVAYVANILCILGVTLHDNFRRSYARSRRNPFKNKWLAFAFDYFLVEKHDLTSMKSSLYLFYIFALVTSHVLMLNPEMDVSESTRNYFTNIGYGLILLVAADKFLGQFRRDDKFIQEFEQECESSGVQE